MAQSKFEKVKVDFRDDDTLVLQAHAGRKRILTLDEAQELLLELSAKLYVLQGEVATSKTSVVEAARHEAKERGFDGTPERRRARREFERAAR